MRRVALGAVVLLAGCTYGGMSDLEAYVDEVTSRSEAPIQPVPEIRQAEFYAYRASAEGRRDPFTEEKEEVSDQVPVIGGIRPDETRPREELEAFSLDTLRMVGTWTGNDGSKWGLVKHKDGVIYRVQPGNYMGQNHGHVTAVYEDRIELVEIVPDRVGGYVEQPTQLAIGE